MISRSMNVMAFVAVALQASSCDAPYLRGIPSLRGPNDTASCAPNAAARDLAAAVFPDRVQLRWRSDAVDEDGFLIERRLEGSFLWGELIRLPADTYQFNDYNIENDRRYIYRAKTFRTAATELCESIATDDLWVTTVPAAPEDLTAVALSTTEVRLRWRDPNRLETGFRLERDSFGEGFVVLGEVAADTTTFIDSTAEPRWSYTYRLVAYNDSGDSNGVETTYAGPQPPELSWTKPPELAVDCTLVLFGEAGLDSEAGAALASAEGTLSIPILEDSTAAGPWGFSAVLDDPPAGVYTSEWRVEDSLGATSSLSRDLLLSATERVRGLTRPGTRVPGDSTSQGAQALLRGCGQCTGRRGTISAGGLHSCAIVGDGEVSCWGDGTYNRTGRGIAEDQLWPRRVCRGGMGDPCKEPLTAVDLAVARYALSSSSFSCVRRPDHTAWCWGFNDKGQLGDGTSKTRFVPTQVCQSSTGSSCTPLSGVRELTLGEDFTCARLDSTEVACWGENGYGQLGNGDVDGDDSLIPTIACAPPPAGPITDCEPLIGAVALTAGTYHTCALMADTRVRCWGRNDRGQLGDGNSGGSRRSPVHVCETGLWDGSQCSDSGDESSLTGVVAISAGSSHTCALLDDATARCWGRNNVGQLGAGFANSNPVIIPVPVCGSGSVATGDCDVLTGIHAISAGYDFTCALHGPNREVSCWGNDDYSRLGNPGVAGDAYNPVPVCRAGPGCTPLDQMTRLYAGADGACAVRGSDRTTWCWGKNSSGQLGAGNTEEQPRATPVCRNGGGESCEPLLDAVMVWPGDVQSCALIADTGEVYCWGDISDGLGLGIYYHSIYDEYRPQGAPLLACANESGPDCEPLADVIQVAAGFHQTCALHADTRVSCFGLNDSGQLGNGEMSSSNIGSNTVTVCRANAGETCEPLEGVTAIATGGIEFELSDANHTIDRMAHSCAITADGGVWCWGDNRYGQLGIGFGGLFTELACTSPFDCVGIDARCDYSAGRCRWTDEDQVNPQAVVCGTEDGLCDPSGQVLRHGMAVSAGAMHTCAVLDTGAVACWGRNDSGQLGNSTMLDSPTPTMVAIVDDAVAVTTGTWHSCSLSLSGQVRCWGGNGRGQLGNGVHGGNRQVPVRVCAAGNGADCEPLTGVVAIAAFHVTTCALIEDGTVRCWGANDYGQLGQGFYGGDTVFSLPLPVCGPRDGTRCPEAGEECQGYLTDVVAIDVGLYHACALRGDGVILCWGNNWASQIGIDEGEYNDRSICSPTTTCEYGTGRCLSQQPAAGFAIQTCTELAVEVAP